MRDLIAIAVIGSILGNSGFGDKLSRAAGTLIRGNPVAAAYALTGLSGWGGAPDVVFANGYAPITTGPYSGKFN